MMKLDVAEIVTIRRGLILAVVLVVALLLYTYFTTRGGVLDPSNDPTLSAEFDQLNPNIPGTNGGNPGSDDSDSDANS